MSVSLNTGAMQTRFASFWSEAKGLPSKDLGVLLKKHGLEHTPVKFLSRMANAVGMPRDARLALLGQQQLNLRSLAGSTKAISAQGLATGKAFENRQLGRVGTWFSARFPGLSSRASSAVSKVGSFSGRVGEAAAKATKSAGFFGRMLGKVGGVLSKVGSVARMVPFLNVAFVAIDAFKFLKNPSMANLAKLGLSVGAALPIPGASLLGGVRAAVDIVPMVASLGSRSPQPA